MSKSEDDLLVFTQRTEETESEIEGEPNKYFLVKEVHMYNKQNQDRKLKFTNTLEFQKQEFENPELIEKEKTTDFSQLFCINDFVRQVIFPTKDLRGLRIVTLGTCEDEGYLVEHIHQKPIIMVKYDRSGNYLTSSEGKRICVIDRALEKKYIETKSPTISMVESKDGNYIFTGRRDMKVTVWFKGWTRLGEF